MHHEKKDNSLPRKNLTYDLAEGHNITLMGSMNAARPDENVIYELSEGPNARLKGSMNDVDMAYHLLSLRQGDAGGQHGNISQESPRDLGQQ